MVVDGQTWPAMPPPPIDEFQIWVDANATSPRLIDAFGDWITAGKIDNSPQDAPYNFASLSTASVAQWPLKNLEYTAVLFVASMPNDSGRRPGDGALPNPPAVPVPAHFWATSQIALSYPPGVAGQRRARSPIRSPEARRGILGAGADRQCRDHRRGPDHQPHLSQGPDPGRRAVLQHLHQPRHVAAVARQIDPLGPNVAYEQHYTAGLVHDIVGFRFNVDRCSRPWRRRSAQVPPAMLGDIPAAEWLREGHPCVKVRIMSGEQLDHYPPAGGAPQPPTLTSNPLVDRHIAQRNLAPFSPTKWG